MWIHVFLALLGTSLTTSEVPLELASQMFSSKLQTLFGCAFAPDNDQQPMWFAERFLRYRCPKVPVANGAIENSRCVDNVQYADIECDEGHEVGPDGDNMKTIQCDNSTYTWIGLENCTARQCPEVTLKNTDRDLPATDYGSSPIPINCENGFSVRDPQRTSFNADCKANGKWRRAWDCERDCSDFVYSSDLELGFKLLETPGQNRTDNQVACEALDGTLVKATSYFREFWDDTLKDMASENRYHIGLMRDENGRWKWDDGTELSFNDAQWCDSVNMAASRMCAHMSKSKECWDTSNCLGERFAICEIDCVKIPEDK